MGGEDESALIADEAALEAFFRLPAEQRQLSDSLSDSLKGVLAETACTGVIRYDWRLVRPLLAALMAAQLRGFEAAEQAALEVGPARPLALSGAETLDGVLQRFDCLLERFGGAPWTLQRLCEVLLEPRKQYQRLHKLVLALEKLLLVTGELAPTSSPGPRPRLAALAAVNEVPPPPGAAAGAGAADDGSGGARHKRPRQYDADGGGLLAATLDVCGPPPGSSAAGEDDAAATEPAPSAVARAAASAAVVEEDAAASAAAGMQQDSGGGGGGGAPLAPASEPAGSTAASSQTPPAAVPSLAAAPMDTS